MHNDIPVAVDPDDTGPDETGASARGSASNGVVEIAGKRYFEDDRLAAVLGVSVRTLRRWHRDRIGPPRIKIGNKILTAEDVVPGWLAEHESQPVRLIRRGRR